VVPYIFRAFGIRPANSPQFRAPNASQSLTNPLWPAGFGKCTPKFQNHQSFAPSPHRRSLVLPPFLGIALVQNARLLTPKIVLRAVERRPNLQLLTAQHVTSIDSNPLKFQNAKTHSFYP
jgi:hypothetical protein